MRFTLALKAAVAGTLALGALTLPASSAEAQDRFNFNGAVDLYDAPGTGGANLLLDFLVAGATGGTPTGTIRATETLSGDFAANLAVGQEGVIQDLVITPGAPFVQGLTVGNFITIGPYTFALEGADEGNTFGPISLFQIGRNTQAGFGVFGTVFGGGYGTTGRSFEGTFSAQFAGMTPDQVVATINSGGRLEAVAFSAELVTGASVVPEPSTYILLATGLGVLGLVGLRRRGTQV